MTEEIELHTATDEPDSRDFSYSEAFGSVEPDFPLPEKFSFLPPEILNQYADPRSRMACTRFSVTHIANGQNKHVADATGKEYMAYSALAMWLEAVNANPAILTDGDSIQNGIKQWVAMGMFTGYAKCEDVEIKRALFACRGIATGSIDGNWAETKRTGIYSRRTDGKKLGHAFCFVGWDDSKGGYVCANSDWRTFVLPYGLVSTLYTRYSVSDHRDEKSLSDYELKIMEGIKIEDAKKAYESGIWSGERPGDTVTREEAAAMVYRAGIKN